MDAMRTSASQVQASQPDTRIMDTIEAEAAKLREKIDAQRATGNIDPTEMARYMTLQQNIAMETLRQPDNASFNALLDEAHSLALKIDAQMQAGTADPQDTQRYQLLTQRINAEGAVMKFNALRMGAMGAYGAMETGAVMGAGTMGAARPLDPTDTSGGAIPMHQMLMQPGFQQMPQAAARPAIGSQVVCPMCGATTVIGAAGICTNCGNKISL